MKSRKPKIHFFTLIYKLPGETVADRWRPSACKPRRTLKAIRELMDTTEPRYLGYTIGYCRHDNVGR
jgi:hypothetical protein